VAGSAPGFGVAVLLADGRERNVRTIKEGYYSFTFQAEKPMRSVQIQVYGDRMPTMYTRALPIPDNFLATEMKDTEDSETIQKPTIAAKPRKEPDAPIKVASKPGSSPETPAVTLSDTGVESPSTRPESAFTETVSPKAVSRKTRTLSAPPKLKPGEDMDRGHSGSRTVAVTFDGGSYSNAAQRILDVLAKRDLKATFFLTGEFMNHYPEVTRRIADEGHEVGNHTYSHLHLTTFEKNFKQDTLPGISKEVLLAELRKNEALYEELTGAMMVKLWRAPYGEQNETIRNWASSEGYQHVSWTYDPKTRKSLDGLDWVSDQASALYLTSEEIIEKIISFDSQTEMGLAGGIVLLHLGSERKDDPFHPKLGQLIDKLREKGYEVGSVGSLLAKGG
jgi:peptidoglycan/xylan/chitin deacetylase (PgdA/CDA1 family)